MRVWFRTEIPAKATEDQVKNGLTYREIPEGTLVGAIEFPAKFTDFRKQELARRGLHAPLRHSARHRRSHRHGTEPGVLPHLPGRQGQEQRGHREEETHRAVQPGERRPAPRGAAVVAEQRQGHRREDSRQGRRRVRRHDQAAGGRGRSEGNARVRRDRGGNVEAVIRTTSPERQQGQAAVPLLALRACVLLRRSDLHLVRANHGLTTGEAQELGVVVRVQAKGGGWDSFASSVTRSGTMVGS